MADSSSFFLTVTIRAQDRGDAEAIRRWIEQAIKAMQHEGNSTAPFHCHLGSLTAATKEITGAFRRNGKIWFVDCENATGGIESAQVGSRENALGWLESRAATQIHEGKRLLSTRGVSMADTLAAPATSKAAHAVMERRSNRRHR